MSHPRLAGAAAVAGFLFAAGSYAYAWVHPLSAYGRPVAMTCGVVLALELVSIMVFAISIPSEDEQPVRPSRSRALSAVLGMAMLGGIMVALARDPGVVLGGLVVLVVTLPNHFILQWREPVQLRREAMAATVAFFAPVLMLLPGVPWVPPRLGVTEEVERLILGPAANGAHELFALATAYFLLRVLFSLVFLARDWHLNGRENS